MGSKNTSGGTRSLADSGFGSGESCSTTPSLSRISQGGSEGLSQDLIQGLKLEILGLTKLVKSLQLEMQELKEDRRCQPICQCILTNPSEVPLINHKERPSHTQPPPSPEIQKVRLSHSQPTSFLRAQKARLSHSQPSSSPETQEVGPSGTKPPFSPDNQANATPIQMSDIQSGIGYPTHAARKSDKRLLFPKFEDFVSFNQYVLSLNSHVDALISMGHADKTVAEQLYQFLAQSQHSAQFLHQIKNCGRGAKLDSSTILSALQKSEFGTALDSPEERFKKLKKVNRETLGSFLMRCEQYGQDVPFFAKNPEVQRWQVKMQFLRGARIPQWMHDKLLPYASLSEFLLACKRLLEEEVPWKQSSRRKQMYGAEGFGPDPHNHSRFHIARTFGTSWPRRAAALNQ